MTEYSYQRIAASFHQRIDAIANAVDSMAPGLAAAASLLSQAVLEDRKILISACEEDAVLAELVATVLRTPIEPGPALPALALRSDSHEGDPTLWRNLRTLSRDGDVLLCIDSGAGATLARKYVEFAEKRNLIAIVLSEKLEISGGTCIALNVEHPDLRRELILMASHCLRDQTKQVLLGE
ncbi:phosphoheptose isomerase [Congregibacter sp.]|uniref:phosphoheptose isomerase n=1 Tax=Congregibacter sp. TaxID=2744308 RepID=UPI003F6CDAEF